jgi:replicative DNA helicase
MSKEQLVLRLLGSESRVDAHKLRTGHLSERDWTPLSNAAGRLAEAPIYIDDTAAISALEMRAKARRLKAEHGLDLLIVDYLQLMRGRGDEGSREQEISNISRSLKALAKELQIPVIGFSSTAQETRPGKKRPMPRPRESGLEQDADVILSIAMKSIIANVRMMNACAAGKAAEVIIESGEMPTAKLTHVHKQVHYVENAKRF